MVLSLFRGTAIVELFTHILEMSLGGQRKICFVCLRLVRFVVLCRRQSDLSALPALSASLSASLPASPTASLQPPIRAGCRDRAGTAPMDASHEKLFFEANMSQFCEFIVFCE